MEDVEQIVLANLVENETFTRKVIPYIMSEYFTAPTTRALFDVIEAYVTKYNALPTKEAMFLDIVDKEIGEDVKDDCDGLISSLKVEPNTNLEWLMKKTEDFCKERAIKIALTKSLAIIQDKDKGSLSVGAIPNIMSTAIGMCFDSHIGHSYFKDADERWDYLHTKENKIPFDVEILNKITRGGLPNGTLSIIIAGTNVGKSAIMCHMAAANVKIGKNVLYITLEMGEEKIGQRVDANLIDMTIDETYKLEKEDFLRRVATVKKLTTGEIVVKQYPTKQGSCANFRFLLNELKLKNNFVPDIIYVDYMNICTSASMKGSRAPLDQLIVSISEELRGLAVEYNLPIVTATQFNREGFQKNNPGMEDTAQAFGVAFIADFIIALVRTEELDAQHQILCIQLKNRESNPADLRNFTMGVNIDKMQFFDVADPAGGLVNEKHEAEIGLAFYEGITLPEVPTNKLDITGGGFIGLF